MTTERVDLLVGGMTCASCATRIEKKLNRMPGVEASVNYATEKASVSLPEGTSVDQAIAVIEDTGYTAELPRPPKPAAGDAGDTAAPTAQELEVASLRHRLIAVGLPHQLRGRERMGSCRRYGDDDQPL